MIFTREDSIEILENAISWIVVFALFIYGGGKLFQFEGAAAIEKTVSEMTGMELMWAFYGYSKPFAITLGLFEIVGGILLLIKRTRIIGCLFTTTLLVNIIIQDIFYGVHVGALKAAILYQFLILVVLWLNRKKLIKGIKAILELDRTQQTKRKVLVKFLIAAVAFIGLRIVEYFITMKL